MCVGHAHSCNFPNLPESCCELMSNAGLQLESYNLSVAHGIHSITVEQLNYYFDGDVDAENDIPTTNSDLSSEEGVLPSAPQINKDASILTPSMMMLDFIMTNNDEIDSFLIKGLSSLEKLAHAAHMQELYARTKIEYDNILSNPPGDNGLCDCITDEENNGILERLEFISEYLRHFKSPKGLGGRAMPIDFLYGGSFKYDNFEYGTKFKYSGMSNGHGSMARPQLSRLDVDAAEVHETPASLPKLVDSDTWLAWKAMLKNSMPGQKERFNLAMYLYCKLNVNF